MNECQSWIISKQVQKKLEATEMRFLTGMLKISWTAKKSNKTVLPEANTRSPINRIHKHQATFFGLVMRREHLVITGMITGKKREKMLDGLTKWLKVHRVTQALKATRDRDARKVMIAYTKEDST